MGSNSRQGCTRRLLRRADQHAVLAARLYAEEADFLIARMTVAEELAHRRENRIETASTDTLYPVFAYPLRKRQF
ncbi:hypothetical protein BO443_10551 [Burkholderia orbicola]